MKYRILLLLFMGLLLYSALSAQKYQPGYIITNQLDTLYGLISNNGYVKNSKTCKFKKIEGEKPTIYKPFEINSYRFIDGKYYISKEVELDSTKYKVFLEYLVKGKVSIYYLHNLDGDYYFIQKDNEILVPLKTDEHLMSYDAIQHKWEQASGITNAEILRTKKYVGTIKYIMRDAPQLNDEIDKLQLEPKSLIKISNDYQKLVCKNEQCTVYEKATKGSFGIALTDIINSINYSDKPHGKTKSSKNIYNSFGISIICQLPLLNEKVSFIPSIIYGKFSFNNNKFGVFAFQSGQNLSIPLAFQYKFITQKKSSLYFNLGPEIDLTTAKLDSAGVYSYGVFVPVEGASSYQGYDPKWPKGIFIGGTASLGFNYKLLRQVFLDIAFNYSLGTKSAYIYRNFMGAMISIGYLFKEK